jgi:hypothetical protein
MYICPVCLEVAEVPNAVAHPGTECYSKSGMAREPIRFSKYLKSERMRIEDELESIRVILHKRMLD